MKNSKKTRELRKLKKDFKMYKRKNDYDGLFGIRQEIISERKNSLKKKIDDCTEKYKQYINKTQQNNETKTLSEKELNEISFFTEQLNTLSATYDTCSKLETELKKKNIYELITEAENQYNEYLKEITKPKKTFGSLEARIGIVFANTFLAGATTYGFTNELIKGNYKTTAIFGALTALNGLIAYFNGRSVMRECKEKSEDF